MKHIATAIAAVVLLGLAAMPQARAFSIQSINNGTADGGQKFSDPDTAPLPFQNQATPNQPGQQSYSFHGSNFSLSISRGDPLTGRSMFTDPWRMTHPDNRFNNNAGGDNGD